MTPSRAITHFKEKLRDECHDPLAYQLALADRSKMPRRGDFYNIFTTYFKEVYGAKNGEKMMEALNRRIEQSKVEDPGITIFKQSFDSKNDQPFILVVVTPFMKRVHSMVSNFDTHFFLKISLFAQVQSAFYSCIG